MLQLPMPLHQKQPLDHPNAQSPAAAPGFRPSRLLTFCDHLLSGEPNSNLVLVPHQLPLHPCLPRVPRGTTPPYPGRPEL